MCRPMEQYHDMYMKDKQNIDRLDKDITAKLRHGSFLIQILIDDYSRCYYVRNGDKRIILGQFRH